MKLEKFKTPVSTEKELFLAVYLDNDVFEVSREISEPVGNYTSVFVVDSFPYTPWVREGGNLLW